MWTWSLAKISAISNKDLEDTSLTLNQEVVDSQRTRVITYLPELAVQGCLVEGRGINLAWTMELSIPLSAEEGEFLLGSFIPDRAESPNIN